MEDNIVDGLVSGTVNQEDKQIELSLRPENLGAFVGQPDLKQQLDIFLQAAKKREEALDHVLFYGPPGLGKTTLAMILGKEMGVSVVFTSGPSLTRAGDIASILTDIQPKGILFIDEIHRLPKAVEETLYTAMEDYAIDVVLGKGATAKVVRLNLPKFTLVGATTRIGMIAGPLRDRFGSVYQLDFYEPEDLRHIIGLSAEKLGVEIDDEAAAEIAKRARGTPRIANRLLRRVRDYAQVKSDGRISLREARMALDSLGVNEKGLSTADRRYLEVLKKQYNNGPVGVENLAAALSEDVETIEDVYEPFLMKLGLIQRTSRGRVGV